MEITNFLTQYKVQNDNYNHVLLTPPFGKYKIPDTPIVIESLHDLLESCIAKQVDIGLCECHDDELDEPLYYDIDLSLKEAVNVTDDTIKNFIQILNLTITKTLDVSNDSLKAFVMKKPNCLEEKSGENYWHVGIHVIYPFIRLNSIGRQIIYDKLVKNIRKENSFKHLPLYEDEIEKIVDKQVIRKNAIIMVGCNKKGKQRYELYQVYDSNTQLVDTVYSTRYLMKICSLRYNYRTSTQIISYFKESIDVEKLGEEIYIKDTFKKDGVVKGGKHHDKKLDKEKIDKIRRLVNILSPNRASSYDEWVKVGLCLHNISDCEELLKIWEEWSQSAKQKANKTNFQKVWKTFKQRDDGLKFGTLSLWAKQDDEKAFLQFKLDEIDNRIKTSIEENTSFDIAKVLREMYDGVYICSSIKHKEWYEFRGHRYVEIQEGYTLFINISEELVRAYNKKHIELDVERVELKKKSFDEGTSNFSDIAETSNQLVAKMNIITKLIEKLKDTNFKNKIMAESRNLFYDENFENKLNENRHILVFNDGVYDLDNQEFRNGRPEDYMSFTTGINYMEYNENDPDIQKVFDVFSQIHPRDEMRHFFFITLAAGLHGFKKEQKIDIWTGSGSNGKSLTSDFVSKALGDYYDSPSITLLTRKRGASAQASPDLVKLKGKRINFFLEPEYDDTLHSSMLKQLTGNDCIEGRGLFKGFIKFKPQSSYFLACNDLPTIESNDGGTWRRIRVLEFKSKFVNNPVHENEFKIDITLQEQIGNLAPAFMAILIYYWGKFSASGFKINEPPCVQEYTKKYQSNSNVYLEFINENIEDDSESKLSYNDVWNQYKFWLKGACPNMKCPKKREAQNQFESMLGKCDKSGWVGKKLKDELIENN